jgi:uncharacterized protein YgbK (DUF1537 family)
MPQTELLLSFYGDDFTGSTDAMESLARRGVRTVLFTEPPSAEQLLEYPGLQAFGIAGMTRSLSPEVMEYTLRPVFRSLRANGSPIVHYKVCSTFDSSPTVGSIGRVIDIGIEVFGRSIVPVLAAAPALGRYSVFGNLFARCGGESEPYRLDRHPSMSRHPVTPMNEADLCLHLSKQTKHKIGLLDVLKMELPTSEIRQHFDSLIASNAKVGFIDALNDSHLGKIGALLAGYADRQTPLFVVGSSGIEAAMCDHWRFPATQFSPVKYRGPIIAVCGSCSPVTAGQIQWARQHGFTEVAIDVRDLSNATIDRSFSQAIAALKKQTSVVIHTAGDQERIADAAPRIAPALATIVRSVLDRTPVVRMLIAGGDTSSQIARALGIVSVEMIGELTRGSPLCKVHAPQSPADGLEITFKGGQIGNQDFFGVVERGSVA